MKVTQRLPLEQYSYVEFEGEYESIEDAMTDHARLLSEYKQVGLAEREWAKVRNNMLVTGQFDPNLSQELNKSQRYCINQIKLALRSAEATDPVIN